MRVSKFVLFTACFLCIASSAGNVFAQRRDLRAREAVESGGWHVAYGNELGKRDVYHGTVEPGVSLYERRDRREVRTWANSMLRQAIALLVNREGADSVRRFREGKQRDARKFFVDTVKELLRSNTSGAQILDTGSIDVKVGVMEYGRRRHVLVPYIGLRSKYISHRSRYPHHRDWDYHSYDRDRDDDYRDMRWYRRY